MKSPLSIYQEVADKFGISGDKELPKDQQLHYIQQQLQEMRLIVNRALVDIVGLEKNRQDAKDEMSRDAYGRGLDEHYSQIRQYSNKMDALLELQKELEG